MPCQKIGAGLGRKIRDILDSRPGYYPRNRLCWWIPSCVVAMRFVHTSYALTLT
jgi:hypothetical protein